MSELDLTKLGRILGMVGSNSDNEALVAARTADRMLRASGRTWADFIDAQAELKVASEAAAVLLAENRQLQAENERLHRDANHSSALVPWQDIGGGSSGGGGVARTNLRAIWMLNLAQQQRVHLSEWEIDFLSTCSTRFRPLTTRQAPIFDRLLTLVTARTGLTPPP